MTLYHFHFLEKILFISLIEHMKCVAYVYTVLSRKSAHSAKSAHPTLLAQFSI